MEHLGENFRGTGGPAICPLCKLHLDNQEQSLQCKVVKSEITIKGKLKTSTSKKSKWKLQTLQNLEN